MRCEQIRSRSLYHARWSTLEYASKAMTKAQTGYAQIEKELLSTVFGMKKFGHLVFGRHVNVQTARNNLQEVNGKCAKQAATEDA